ncbi:hypothetical protein JDV02_004641 [Purpureocillium takamizusanense]|uniref:Major facilitator superfamily (MFS) profile domain-containing protein n=1 Tax=Purpureocillium takamizusanense TaxID=2060973 RepID=A0A9Q8QEA7_9HYPO|nr:uncharacterized protein JDV02_004641 [Purpureocillium takamizusanense]UNI18368.1 hypothetical protein JDV02_004641 [Purpureocillium takamizusanense]
MPSFPDTTGRPSDATVDTPLLTKGHRTDNAADLDTDSASIPSYTSASAPPDDGEDARVEQQQQQQQHHRDKEKPLPTFQILLLCYARLMEPIAFYSIFPYIAQMVQRNAHVADADVGFYSGAIESLFSMAQMAVMMLWSSLANRFGRKPMLVYSLVGMAVGPALFGMATTLWQMILFRCLTGVFSSADLIIRTMVGEHCTTQTQARAFSWYSFASNMGVLVGPIVGGALADPASQYPSVFGGIEFFDRYAYALPGFVVAAIGVTGAVSSAVFLDETLQKSSSSSSLVQQRVPEQASTWQLIKGPGVAIVLFIYGQVMLLSYAFVALLPIALYTSVDLGGMGCSPSEITIYMTIQGGSEALWLLIVFPLLQRRIGTKGVLAVCAVAFPLFFAGYIVINALLRQQEGHGHHMGVLTWVVGCIVAFVGPGVWMAFTGVQLAINKVSPNPRALGTLNAVAESCSGIVRSFVPGLSTSIFAVGVREQILLGYLAWVVLIVLSVVLILCLRWLPSEMFRDEKQRL